MTSRESFVLDLPGDPRLVWALMGDTNRSSRAMGLAAGSLRMGDDGVVLEGRQLGRRVEWLSGPDGWIEGRWYRAVRRYRRGPAQEGVIEARFEPRPGGVRVSIERRTSGGLAAMLFDRWVIGPRLRRYLRDGAELVARARPSTGAVPAAAALRPVLGQAATTALAGPAHPVHEAELAVRARRLRERPVDERLVERFLHALREMPDEEVAALAPFRLADLWSEPRRDVLRLFLLATHAGLLELRWKLRCQVCRVAARSVDSLEALPSQTQCPGCGTTFDSDLRGHVEAGFSVHPAIRVARGATYCMAGAALRPHVFAQLVAVPGEACEARAALPEEGLVARVLGSPGIPPQLLLPPFTVSLAITVHADRLSAEAAGGPATESALVLRSETGGPAVVALERRDWSEAWVSAADLTSVPEFHELFAGEAPRSRHEVSVGGVSLLFSDLRGSTAMYQKLGDPRAFTVVDGHFELLTTIIEKNEGALVKTMGDAVMAVFQTAPAAVRAALEMQRALASVESGEAAVALKLGIHTGNCLAVRANGRLDFFGHAVNLAARAQAQSHGGDVVVTGPVLEHPEVAALLDGVEREPFEAVLKGIDRPQKLWRLTPRPAQRAAG